MRSPRPLSLSENSPSSRSASQKIMPILPKTLNCSVKGYAPFKEALKPLTSMLMPKSSADPPSMYSSSPPRNWLKSQPPKILKLVSSPLKLADVDAHAAHARPYVEAGAISGHGRRGGQQESTGTAVNTNFMIILQ